MTDNLEKVKLNKALPWLVGNVVEVLDAPEEDQEPQAGGAMDEDDSRRSKACVIKTSTRQTVYLPIPGLVDVNELKPGDLIGTVRARVPGRRSGRAARSPPQPPAAPQRCARHTHTPHAPPPTPALARPAPRVVCARRTRTAT